MFRGCRPQWKSGFCFQTNLDRSDWIMWIGWYIVLSYALIKEYLNSSAQLHGWTVECKLTIEMLSVCELFSKQLLSTNWLNRSAVKREVSLVSLRNFWACRVKTSMNGGFECARFKFSIVLFFWRHLGLPCEVNARQVISLTTWIVVNEVD